MSCILQMVGDGITDCLVRGLAQPRWAVFLYSFVPASGCLTNVNWTDKSIGTHGFGRWWQIVSYIGANNKRMIWIWLLVECWSMHYRSPDPQLDLHHLVCVIRCRVLLNYIFLQWICRDKHFLPLGVMRKNLFFWDLKIEKFDLISLLSHPSPTHVRFQSANPVIVRYSTRLSKTPEIGVWPLDSSSWHEHRWMLWQFHQFLLYCQRESKYSPYACRKSIISVRRDLVFAFAVC